MFSEKIVIRLDSFSKQIIHIWVIFRPISVFELDLPIYSIFLWLLLPDGPISYRVTDEAFIAET